MSDHMLATRRRRRIGVVLLFVIVAAGLGVHLALPDSAITDITGDALYAAAVYALIVILLPGMRPVVVGALSAAWCVAVELFQLTGLPGLWASVFPPVVLALGTVFDPRDLLVYAATIAGITSVDAVISARSTTRADRGSPPPPAD